MPEVARVTFSTTYVVSHYRMGGVQYQAILSEKSLRYEAMDTDRAGL